MNNDWEKQVNDMLDGELSDDEIAALKRQAEQDHDLARAIIEAHSLQVRFDALQIERAPVTLRKRLKSIPKTERAASSGWLGLPRWAAASAMAAPVALVAMVMMSNTAKQPEYTQAEILQAEQDLATAFAYLDQVGSIAGKRIEKELRKELRGGVTDNVARHMPFTHQSMKEDNS